MIRVVVGRSVGGGGGSRDGGPRVAVGGTLPSPGQAGYAAVRVAQGGGQRAIGLGRARVQSNRAGLVHVEDADGYLYGVVNAGIGIARGVLAVVDGYGDRVAGFGLVVQRVLDLDLPAGRVEVESPGVHAGEGVGQSVVVAILGGYRRAHVLAGRRVLRHAAGGGGIGELRFAVGRRLRRWRACRLGLGCVRGAVHLVAGLVRHVAMPHPGPVAVGVLDLPVFQVQRVLLEADPVVVPVGGADDVGEAEGCAVLAGSLIRGPPPPLADLEAQARLPGHGHRPTEGHRNGDGLAGAVGVVAGRAAGNGGTDDDLRPGGLALGLGQVGGLQPQQGGGQGQDGQGWKGAGPKAAQRRRAQQFSTSQVVG